jgi:hypothetical protein
MKRSLTTRENSQILMIGSYGIEKRNGKWKAKGLDDATGNQFTLWEENPGKWRVNGIDSTGARRRERFLAQDLSEAVDQSACILYGGIAQSGHPQLRLSDAFLLAISESGGSPEHKQDYEDFAGYFCDWAERKGIFYWHELRYEHVKSYMNDCLGRGLAPKTVSHYLEPIRMTARFMAANHPEYYRDFCAGLRLPTNVGCDGEYDEDDGVPALLFEEVLDFIDWLEDYPHRAVLQPAVLLMGIAGFQLREALRLQNREVDPVLGTAIIQGHPELGEVVKNKYRIRKIPLPQIFLRYHAAHPNDHRNVVPYDGDDKAFGKLLKRALLAWKADCPIAPKDLRNTLPTHALEHASKEGWNTYLVDRYIGHAPKSQMEKHYFGDTKKRMVEVFREVSDKIDQLVDRIRKAQSGKRHKKARAGEKEMKGRIEENQKGHKKAQVISVVPFFIKEDDAEVA